MKWMNTMVSLLLAGVLASGCTVERHDDVESEIGESPGEGIADRPAEGENAAPGQAREVEMISRGGEVVGTIALRDEDDGLVILVNSDGLEALGLEPGAYGFHIHEFGVCEPPDFESAGGHFDMNDREHGFENPSGPHDGDLPNLVVESNGAATVRIFNARITLDDLRDEDGTSLVLHAEQDDYVTDPTGESGDRVACGVIFPG